MLYAERGYATATVCRLSIRLSLTFRYIYRDNTGSKIISLRRNYVENKAKVSVWADPIGDLA